MHHVDMLMCCLPASQAGLGDGRDIFCVCVSRIVMNLKIIIILAHLLFRAHTWDLLSLMGKNTFFVLRILAMPFQIIQS